MKVIESIEAMWEARLGLPGEVGLVPTMGYLHKGHLTLVRRAREENQSLVTTIFVNPTQFGPKEDYKAYPRDMERDLALLAREKVDIVFMPSAEEMYPPGFNSWVEVRGLTERLEGASRPGHFRGVTTVVAKLFNIVRPYRAYFGQKDAQQLLVIKKMVADLNMNLEVVGVPIVRGEDGLALSSRNSYLNPEERQAATVIWRSLSSAKELWRLGEHNAEAIRQHIRDKVGGEERARLDYLSVADAHTLEELEVVDRPALVSMAVWIGKTRLIDNVLVGE